MFLDILNITNLINGLNYKDIALIRLQRIIVDKTVFEDRYEDSHINAQ